jgi:5'-3' exonuclease
MVELDLNEPVMLIDTSYYIFYRYFAVFNWYKLAQRTVLDVPTILQNKQFMDKFTKLFEDNLEKLRKKHNIPYNNIIFAKDCIRDRIWRYQYYKNYKKTRDEKLTTFNGDIFKYCYNHLMPELQKRLGVQSCEYDSAEADDIIAIFTRHICEITEKKTQIVIVTNDNDYLQLIDDNVMLVNMKSLDLKTRLEYTPDIYLKMKIILGDKSDNIPSVFPKCGDKKAQQLAENEELLEEKLSKSDEFREKYELNKLLIDTTQIPEKIQTDIRNMLKFKEEPVAAA